jgi:hypothetical protein
MARWCLALLALLLPATLVAQSDGRFRIILPDSSVVVGRTVTVVHTRDTVITLVTGSKSTVVIDSVAPRPQPAPVVEAGIPFGPYSWDGDTIFNLSMGSVNASTVTQRIAVARARGVKLVIAMTGGAHSAKNPGCCLSLINGVLQFDRARWDSTMQTLNTAQIGAEVFAGVKDGTIIGANVMDEPHVSGGGDGNTWGPKGTLTKLRVDSLCGSVKRLFPTLPVGVAHNSHIFEPERSYQSCDFLIVQYSHRLGDLTAFRDSALVLGKRDGHAVAFSMNILNGGSQDKDSIWDCKTQGGVKGQAAPNCQMTPAQVREIGRTLGPAGCALLMWRHDAAFMARAEMRAVFAELRGLLAQRPARSCRRVA